MHGSPYHSSCRVPSKVLQAAVTTAVISSALLEVLLTYCLFFALLSASLLCVCPEFPWSRRSGHNLPKHYLTAFGLDRLYHGHPETGQQHSPSCIGSPQESNTDLLANCYQVPLCVQSQGSLQYIPGMLFCLFRGDVSYVGI